jgi:hypothetical protein
VANNKKRISDFELEELMVKAENEGLSDKDADVLLEAYIETFGSIRYGVCLDPHLILRKRKEDKCRDDDAVNKWYSLDDLKVEDKEINIDFMCKKPKQCVSHQMYGDACDCIRSNFTSPAQYKLWREKTILELGNKLRGINPKEK